MPTCDASLIFVQRFDDVDRLLTVGYNLPDDPRLNQTFEDAPPAIGAVPDVIHAAFHLTFCGLAFVLTLQDPAILELRTGDLAFALWRSQVLLDSQFKLGDSQTALAAVLVNAVAAQVTRKE